MKVYEAVFTEGDNLGIHAMSVVEDPAMQDLWIAMKEHPKEIEFASVNEEKRLLMGAAIIPDRKVFRNFDGHECFVTFKEDTIEKIAHSFLQKGNQNNTTLEHQVELKGMSVVENWIVQDPIKDKSANFGKEYPKGTWVVMMKVNNDDVWAKAKNGEIKGFSIEGLLKFKETKQKTNISMSDLKNGIVDAMKSVFSKETKEPDKGFDAEGLQTALVEVFTQFNVNQTKILNDFKADIDKKFEDKDKAFADLKTEFSKAPAAESVQRKTQQNVVPQELDRTGRFLNVLRKAQ